MAPISLPRIATPNPSPSRCLHLGTTWVSQIEYVEKRTLDLHHQHTHLAHGLLCDFCPSSSLATHSNWSVKNPRMILFSSFSLRPHVSKYCQRPSSNKSRPFQLPPQPPQTRPLSSLTRTLAGTPCSGLPASSQILTLQQDRATPRCSSVQNPLIASHFTPRNFPAALHPSRAIS